MDINTLKFDTPRLQFPPLDKVESPDGGIKTLTPTAVPSHADLKIPYRESHAPSLRTPPVPEGEPPRAVSGADQGFSETDLVELMQMFYMVQQQLRYTARLNRDGDFMGRIAEMDKGIADMRTAAYETYWASLTTAILEVASAAVQIGVGIYSACALKSASKQFNAAVESAEGKVTAAKQNGLTGADLDAVTKAAAKDKNLAGIVYKGAMATSDATGKVIEQGSKILLSALKSLPAKSQQNADDARTMKAEHDKEAEIWRNREDKEKEVADDAYQIMREMLQKIQQIQESAMNTEREIVRNI